jgi:hypothetical protein
MSRPHGRTSTRERSHVVRLMLLCAVLASLAGVYLLRSTPSSHAAASDTNILDHDAILAANHLAQPQWYKDNIPFLDTPDDNLDGVYYYRWSTYKRALRYTVPGTGYISTEYDVPIEYASDPYTGLPDAAGYHITDGRWLRNPDYAGSYLDFWLRGAGTSGQRSYSEWIAAAAYQRYLATGDPSQLEKDLPQLIMLYNAWNSNFTNNITVNGQVTDADLYSQSPLSDATEYTETSYKSSNAFTGGNGYRPTVNTYQYAAAQAISKIAAMTGDSATAASFAAKADALKQYVQQQLWDPQRQFFMQVYTNANGNGAFRNTRTTWREAMGFTPWLYELPDPQYSSAWQFLIDPDRFGAPFGPTTLERWQDVAPDASGTFTVPAPGAGTWPVRVYSSAGAQTVTVNGGAAISVPSGSPYAIVNVTLRSGNNTLQFSGAVDKIQANPYFDYQAIPAAPNREDQNCCRWDGPSWPYATSMELTGVANLLHDYPAQSYITAADYRKLLSDFATLQHKDGQPYIAETADGDTGKWIYDGFNFSENYNHSSFNDLVLTGLLGIRPQSNDTLVLDPLVSPDWDYFALEDLPYHGHLMTILWDRNGTHYGHGSGLQVFEDGTRIASSATLTKQTIAIDPPRVAPPAARMMNVAANPLTFDQTWNRKTVTQPYPQAFASFTNPVSNGPHCHSGQTCQPTTFDMPMQATDGWIRYDSIPEDRWTNLGSPNATDYLGVNFGAPRQVDEIKLYTYDDGASIRVPQSFEVQYLDGDIWRPVPNPTAAPAVPVANDANEVTFHTVTTAQLRVVFTPQPGKYVGVTELESWWPEGSEVRIINRNSGLELGVAGAGTAAGAAVQQQPADGSANHRWSLVPAENGYYKIVNENSGLTLGINGASKTAGATALQWGDNLTPDHLWSIVDAGDGWFKLVNRNSGLLLGVQDASTAAGAVALQWTDSGTPDHLWRFGVDTSTSGSVGGTVPATLSLSLGGPASFGAFTPGVAQDYTASTTANVVSTAGSASLSIADPSATATGHLVNGTFSLASNLQAQATSPAGTGAAFAPVGGAASPTALLVYGGPVSNDPVTLAFKQPIAATDPLRTGTYGKTLTFTLSTTQP